MTGVDETIEYYQLQKILHISWYYLPKCAGCSILLKLKAF